MLAVARIGALAVCFAFTTVATVSWVGSANERVAEEAAAVAAETRESKPQRAVAAPADEQYCTIELKRILRRVLKSCGLLDSASGESARGCQPVDAKKVATMSGDDFNALFLPMKERGGIIQFDKGLSEL